MSRAVIKELKDIPADIAEEVYAFFKPLHDKAVDDANDRASQEGFAIKSPEAIGAAMMAMAYTSYALKHILGEVIIQERANRKAIDALRKSLAEQVRE